MRMEGKMPYDFKKEWEKTKKQLMKFGKEASEVAKKGEKELLEFSKKGKLHVDSTAMSLKREHLYYQIGKEYVKIKDAGPQPAKLKKLIDEMNKVDRQQRQLKGKLKPARKRSKTVKQK